MLRALIAAYLVALVVHAHDGMNDDWFKSLVNQNGGLCCDGYDYLRIEDPDWEMKDKTYRVKIDGEWVVVKPENLVKAHNKVGYAIAWPYKAFGGKPMLRCFLPGSAT
jgi:hypothetical protein